MAIYKVPYTTYDFSNKHVNKEFYNYLKINTADLILKDFERFKVDQKIQFKNSFSKSERIVFVIAQILTLVSLSALTIAIIKDFEFANNLLGDIVAYCIMLIFPALFTLSYSYSYGLSRREVIKALKKRKINLLKSQAIAKKTASYNQFLEKITISTHEL